MVSLRPANPAVAGKFLTLLISLTLLNLPAPSFMSKLELDISLVFSLILVIYNEFKFSNVFMLSDLPCIGAILLTHFLSPKIGFSSGNTNPSFFISLPNKFDKPFLEFGYVLPICYVFPVIFYDLSI